MIKAIFHIKTILLQLTYLKQFLLYFHKVKFSIDKLKAMISYPLESFNQTDKAEELKSEIKAIGKILINKLKNWKEYKPIRGIIEDFFKVGKDAFGLGKFHSYTTESMNRNIYLCILLTTLVVQQGYKTKTSLQRLSEGDVVQETPVSKKKKNKKDKNKTKSKNNKKSNKLKNEEQQELDVKIKLIQSNLYDFN